ncbi:recombinase family protein [Limimaricola sp. G21655-S1]|uniref:recombinase family protein n=1 Tax=Limimaricola sp. G21655-S1 TaxID=3014768 RepID=UPI0022AECB49|nr:recombinase family protein [Limimaricola sp. G21655-S1]MCZ4263015.1 recombinase family protein [Limimaricola sp. G21655-S1]
MRAAIYARYSSDLQSANSIEDQIRLCREVLEREGAPAVEIYTDYALSGGALKTRPGMQALLADLRAKGFDMVVAEALDRVSRDQEDVAAIFKRITHAKARLLTLAEGEISELHIGLKGTMNALFLKDLAQKTRRGLRGRVEAGFSGGGNSYGYRVVRRFLADGTAVTGEREIEPTEAEIVRRIFDEYAAGHPPRKIVAALNAEGIPGPRGGAWNASTVNGSRQRRNGILNNELYLGRLIWNRQHFVKDPETGKRISRPNPKAEWITTEVPELRIIDDETWARVQELKRRYAGWAGNTRQTKKRLLSGLAVCACCGGSMTIARRDRYYCATRREKGTCEARHGIAVVDLETRVLGGLQRLLVGNEALLEAFAEAFRQELARLRGSRQSDATKLRRGLAETERGIARCLDYILSSDTPPASVRRKLQDLEADKTRLEAELARIEADLPAPAIEIHPNVPELYRRQVSKLTALLDDEDTRPEAMESIRSLIDRIEVGPPETGRGPCSVTLVGALASVLAFVSEGIETRNRRALAGQGGSAFGTCLLVAGAGFEPATFRL